MYVALAIKPRAFCMLGYITALVQALYMIYPYQDIEQTTGQITIH